MYNFVLTCLLVFCAAAIVLGYRFVLMTLLFFCAAVLAYLMAFYYLYLPFTYRRGLANALGLTSDELSSVVISYKQIAIAKKTGGKRTIHIPNERLKAIQRRILNRILYKEQVHKYAHGFRKYHSIVDNARPHCKRAVVIKLDVRNFFPSIGAGKVNKLFEKQGWDSWASNKLAEICCYEGALPQGAPTSPAISNILFYELDAKFSQLAWAYKSRYTRYADDLTFSLAEDKPEHVRAIIKITQRILEKDGFRLNFKKSKIQVLRRHQSQRICGITVNNKTPTLSRKTRRKLRSIRHRLENEKSATMTMNQLEGWESFNRMIENDVNRESPFSKK